MGEEWESPGWSITETDSVTFSAISGEWSPVHTDEEYGKRSPYKTRIAHGLLELAAGEGLKQPMPAFADVRYMASLYWIYKFSGPIPIGDTIWIRVKIASKRESKKPDSRIVVEYVTMVNQQARSCRKGSTV